jgi:hypothetical protein
VGSEYLFGDFLRLSAFSFNVPPAKSFIVLHRVAVLERFPMRGGTDVAARRRAPNVSSNEQLAQRANQQCHSTVPYSRFVCRSRASPKVLPLRLSNSRTTISPKTNSTSSKRLPIGRTEVALPSVSSAIVCAGRYTISSAAREVFPSVCAVRQTTVAPSR